MLLGGVCEVSGRGSVSGSESVFWVVFGCFAWTCPPFFGRVRGRLDTKRANIRLESAEVVIVSACPGIFANRTHHGGGMVSKYKEEIVRYESHLYIYIFNKDIWTSIYLYPFLPFSQKENGNFLTLGHRGHFARTSLDIAPI